MPLHPSKASTAVRVTRCAVWPLAFFLMFPDLWELALVEIPILCVVAALGIWGAITVHNWLRIGIATVLVCILFGGGCEYESVARSIITHSGPNAGNFSDGVHAMLDALKPFRPYMLLAAAGLFSMAISQSRSPITGKAQPGDGRQHSTRRAVSSDEP